MCGIVAYVGQQEALPIIIKGLKRLEYRGYDSAGIMLHDGNTVRVTKTKGKVTDLEAKTIAERDPMHRSGARSFRIRPWMINEGGVSVRLNFSNQSFELI